MEFTPMWKFTQNISYWTCNLAFNTVLWRTQASIFLFWMVGKSQCITTGTSTTLSVFRILQKSHRPSPCRPYFLTHTIPLVPIRPNNFPQRFLSHISGTMPVSAAGHWKPRLHHSSSFSDSISIPKHCKGASTSRQWFGKFFLAVSLDWFFAQALLDMSLSFSRWSLLCSS